jgi:hypothetical protein
MRSITKYLLVFVLIFLTAHSAHIRNLQESKNDLFAKIEAAVRKEKVDLKDAKACVVNKRILYGGDDKDKITLIFVCDAKNEKYTANVERQAGVITIKNVIKSSLR